MTSLKRRKLWKKLARIAASQSRKCFRQDPLENKIAQIRHMNACTENGQVAIMGRGMDCDGSAWDDRFYCLLPAIPTLIQRWLNEKYEQAEGPESYWLVKPSEVEDHEEQNRDLALEAFEDGHSHVLYY
jgi:hypothetical protein